MSSFEISDRGFWFCENEEGHCFDKFLCKEILSILKENRIQEIVDFGCGPGRYVAAILNEGYDCMGYDGNPNTPKYTNNTCDVLDLSNDFQLDKNFDCVMSLEVGEHIPKEYEQVFIDNITKHSKRMLICSWAVVGQGGDGHVNCQNNDYVIEQIEKRGFSLDHNMSNRIRSSASLSWFKNTLFVFWRNEQ